MQSEMEAQIKKIDKIEHEEQVEVHVSDEILNVNSFGKSKQSCVHAKNEKFNFSSNVYEKDKVPIVSECRIRDCRELSVYHIVTCKPYMCGLPEPSI
jgi:hypothetical protein